MARRAHDPADPGLGHHHCGATGEPRRRPAGGVCDPARGRLVLLDLSLALAGLGLCPGLAFGAISYRFVEQPFRIRRDFWTPRRLLGGSAVAFALLAGFVSLTFLNKGFPGRLPEYLLPAELARRTSTPRDECFRDVNSTKRAIETYCSFGSAQAAGKPTAILWGDSFANQYLEPVSSAALANGIHGLIATQSSCRAFVDDAAVNAGGQPPCRQFNRSTLDFVLAQAEPSIVVLGSNWASGAEISALTDRLLAAGKTVVVIMP